MSHERKQLEKVFGSVYKKMAGTNPFVCAYCGFLKQCDDHVPPITFAADYAHSAPFFRRGGQLLLIPSCTECNQFLGDMHLITYADRLVYLRTKYMKLASITAWDDSEIEDLGPNLKSMLVVQELKRRHHAEKLRGVEEAIIRLPDNCEKGGLNQLQADSATLHHKTALS